MHFVYIVRCADGTLYTGYARDPNGRAKVHNAGRGAKYTATRLPVRLVYAEKRRSRSAALKREYEIKCLSRAEKLALVEANTTRRRAPRAPRPRRSSRPD